MGAENSSLGLTEQRAHDAGDDEDDGPENQVLGLTIWTPTKFKSITKSKLTLSKSTNGQTYNKFIPPRG